MFATVFVTVPTEESAASIGGELVRRGLAACANYYPCRSIYRWKGKVERGDEHILLLKIRSSDFDLVTRSILSLHPDEVPCIVKEDLTDGYAPYMRWLSESTERPGED